VPGKEPVAADVGVAAAVGEVVATVVIIPETVDVKVEDKAAVPEATTVV